MNTIFYNLRDYQSDPRVTVCLVRIEDGPVYKYGRGIAICDFSDKFDEKRGKRKAHKRAMYALNKKDSFFVICSEDALMIMDSVEEINDYAAYKAQYNPLLSKREVEILGLADIGEERNKGYIPGMGMTIDLEGNDPITISSH